MKQNERQDEMSQMTKEQMKNILGGTQKKELRAELQKMLEDNDEDGNPCKYGCMPGCMPGSVNGFEDSTQKRSYPLLK